MKAQDILEFAMYAGKVMIESGGEVRRVEDTIARICTSFGASRIECIVTVTGMDATILYGGELVTLIRRVNKKDINLTKIEQVNQMSRDIAAGTLSLREARVLLMQIDRHIKEYKDIWLILASGISSAFFCLMFKGSLISSVLAFMTGAMTKLVLTLLKKIRFTGYINDLAGGVLISFIAMVLVSVTGVGEMNDIIIGSIMILVPGVAITNAILDIFHQDYISGTVKTVDAFITIIAVSTGVAIVFSVFRIYTGGLI